MDPIINLTMFILLVGSIIVIGYIQGRFGSIGIRGKMRKAQNAPWNLYEFLHLNPSRQNVSEYYRFYEESVRSHSHRYVGRFDSAILHWEEVPILDLVIENKFPVSCLPNQARKEDLFQAGLYALALAETGVSCKESRLVTIYCLQDVAKRCLQGNAPKKCWDCGEGKIFSKVFNPKDVRKALKKLDEVWYNKRNPKASPTPSKCRPCPYGTNGKCKYSVE
jgi:hypothetical protein